MDPSNPTVSNPPERSFNADSLNVRVFSNQDALAAHAAFEVQSYLRKVIDRQGSAAAILATGNSQIQFLRQLINLGGIDWSRVTLFHMDEYLGISREHPASFRRYMRERVETLLKPKEFNYLEGDALLPIDECERYTSLLERQPIDLCCLGVGENGHLAFNDPPVASFNDPRLVKIVQLDRACREQQVNEGHFPNFDAVPPYALTLTIPALCKARKMICIAPESRKANAIRAALEGPVSIECPASFLRTQSQATLLLDHDSASGLRT